MNKSLNGKTIKVIKTYEEIALAFNDVRSTNGSADRYFGEDFKEIADKYDKDSFIESLEGSKCGVDYVEFVEEFNSDLDSYLRWMFINIFVLESDTTVYVILDNDCDYEELMIKFFDAVCILLKVGNPVSTNQITKNIPISDSTNIDSFNKPLFKNF